MKTSFLIDFLLLVIIAFSHNVVAQGFNSNHCLLGEQDSMGDCQKKERSCRIRYPNYLSECLHGKFDKFYIGEKGREELDQYCAGDHLRSKLRVNENLNVEFSYNPHGGYSTGSGIAHTCHAVIRVICATGDRLGDPVRIYWDAVDGKVSNLEWDGGRGSISELLQMSADSCL